MTSKPTSLRLDPKLREQVARAAYWLRVTQTEFIAGALQAAVDQAAAELGGKLDPPPAKRRSNIPRNHHESGEAEFNLRP